MYYYRILNLILPIKIYYNNYLLFINMQIIFVNMLFFGNAISINKGSTLGLILVMPIIFPAVILFGQALTFLR